MRNELSILVVSCDKYSDLWEVFFKLKNKYWANCRYRVYLGSNNIVYDKNGVTTITIGEDKAWADNVRMMLNDIDSDYVLMLLDDFYIDRYIDDDRVDSLFKYVVSNNIDCLRLEPLPGPAFISNKKYQVGKIFPGSPYYTSTQPAIWKKEVLYSLLKPGYSAWDFELKNSNDSNVMYNIEGTKEFAFHHFNAVERGKYYTSTIQFLKCNNISFNDYEREQIDDQKLRYKINIWVYRKIIKLRVVYSSLKFKLCQTVNGRNMFCEDKKSN